VLICWLSRITVSNTDWDTTSTREISRDLLDAILPQLHLWRLYWLMSVESVEDVHSRAPLSVTVRLQGGHHRNGRSTLASHDAERAFSANFNASVSNKKY